MAIAAIPVVPPMHIPVGTPRLDEMKFEIGLLCTHNVCAVMLKNK